SPSSSSAALKRTSSSRPHDSPKGPLPAEHIGTPTTSAMASPERASFDAAELRQPPSARPSHGRSMSLAEFARHSKRLSLNFPIQNSNSSIRSPPIKSARPLTWALDPIVSSVSEGVMASPSPTEGNFLTIIASQERRVLELKDELLQ